MRRADRGVVLGLYRHGPDRALIEHALELGVGGIDTAYNYQDFTSHRLLRETAADLLDEFTVTTKIGYFSDGHSLEPARLYEAAERVVDDLGRPPDVVFLHNPERSLVSFPPGSGGEERLAVAGEALVRATRTGLCGAWGIATWEPWPVVGAVGPHVRPDVLMIRAGLSAADTVLAAAESLASMLDVPSDRRLGMSPFGGSTADPVWRVTNLRTLLAADQQCSNLQAAFRVAYELPTVDRVVVGTSNPVHLDELVAAADLAVDVDAVARYRRLISSAR